jgi:hypothetical protein
VPGFSSSFSLAVGDIVPLLNGSASAYVGWTAGTSGNYSEHRAANMTLATLQPSDDGCPFGFSNATSGYCYAAVSAPNGTSWYAAQDACAALGAVSGVPRAQLASIRDAAQLAVVAQQRCAGLLPPAAVDRVLIGYWDENKEGDWQWASGADPAWFHAAGAWASGEPSNRDASGAPENCGMAMSVDGVVFLNDVACTATTATIFSVSAQPLVGCCEVPLQPASACPPGFTGPNAAGFCYRALSQAGGMSWADANASCRALGNDSALAAVVDSSTATTAVLNGCNGGTAAPPVFWLGLQDTLGRTTETNGRNGSYWRNYGSGQRNDWVISPAGGQGLWESDQPNNALERCVAAVSSNGPAPYVLHDFACGSTVYSAEPFQACCHAPAFNSTFALPHPVLPSPSVTPTAAPSLLPSPSVTPSDSRCPPGFSNATSGYCYAAVAAPAGLSWYEAQTACAALGNTSGAQLATLASIRDPAQRSVALNQRCAGLVPPQDPSDDKFTMWFGFWDENKEGEWQWVSGADPAWFNATAPWALHEPSNSQGVETCALAYMSSNGAELNDIPCSARSSWWAGVEHMITGCCEVPLQPALSCPQGFAGPDAAGFCYRSLNTTGGYTWDGANAACRALGNGSHLAAIADATSAASVVAQLCFGTLAPDLSVFWVGVRDTTGANGHTDRGGSYWRNYGGGQRNDWFVSAAGGQSLWAGSEPNDFNSGVPAENCVLVWQAASGLYDFRCDRVNLEGNGAMAACCQVSAFNGAAAPPSPSPTVTPSAVPTATPSRTVTPSAAPTYVSPRCPPGFSNATSGYCYAAVSAPNGTTWYEAQDACAALGESAGVHLATLATIRDPSQYAAVLTLRCAGLLQGEPAAAAQGVWIGLWDEITEGRFQWVSGADPAYINGTAAWRAGEPNNAGGNQNCGRIFADSETLGDYDCTQRVNSTLHRFAGCCEAPLQPALTCPAGFTGPLASGQCYRGLRAAGGYRGYTWDAANAACRALGNDSALAAVTDSPSSAEVAAQQCAGS